MTVAPVQATRRLAGSGGLVLQGLSMLLRLISPTSPALNHVCGAITGVGGAIPGCVLEWTGCVPEWTGCVPEWTGCVTSAEVQGTSAIAGIVTCLLIIPAILNIAGSVVIWVFHNLSKQDAIE